MRTITCLFFAVATFLLGGIRAGVGQQSDALSQLGALVFVGAALVFAVLDIAVRWNAAGRRHLA